MQYPKRINLNWDKYLCFIVIFAFILYVPLIFFRDFTPDNELKYINIVDHMLKSNDWIKFKFDGILYTDKPPLYFWILAIIRIITGKYSLFSIGFIVCTIPAAIIGTDIYKFLAASGYSRRRAFNIVLILFTTLYFIGSSVIIRMDILMTMFIVKALFHFYNIIENNDKKYYLPYIFMGTGFLVKGLAAVFIPLSAIILYLFITKQKQKIKSLHLLKGFGILLLFLLLWIIPLILSLGFKNTVKELFLKQTVNRAVNATTHKKPIYYYLVNLVVNLFPWMFFFFAGFIFILFKIRKLDKISIFALSWFLAPFIIFSLVSSKLNIYLIPIYGAVAIISEWFLFNSSRLKKVLKIMTSFLFFLFIIMTIIEKKILSDMSPYLFKLLISYGIFSIVTCIAGIYYSVKNETDKFIYNIVLNMTVFTFILAASTPVTNEYIGFNKYTDIIREEKRKNPSLKVIGYKMDEINRMEYILNNDNIININNTTQLSGEKDRNELIILTKNEYLDSLPAIYKTIYSNKKYSVIEYLKEEK